MESFTNPPHSITDTGSPGHSLNAPPLPGSEGRPVYLLPTLLTRIMAIFVDLIIVIFLSAMMAVLIDFFSLEVSPVVKGIVAILIFLFYDPVLTSQSGGTFGHKLLGLKVRKNQARTEYITFPNAILRAIIKGLLGWIVFLTVVLSNEKRGIHDMLSGSIVIK